MYFLKYMGPIVNHLEHFKYTPENSAELSAAQTYFKTLDKIDINGGLLE